MKEKLVVYYIDSTYVVYKGSSGVRTRRKSRTIFRCVFRVKLKDKTNAQGCS